MNSGIKNGKSGDKSFKKLLIGIAAFSVGLILIILTVFVWIPEIKYGKDTYHLSKGDSIYYESIVAHHVHSFGNENAKILAVVYTPA